MANKNIDHAFTARSKTGGALEPTYAGALSFMRRRYTPRPDGRRRRWYGAFRSTPPSPTGRVRVSARRRSAAPRRSSTATRNIRSASIRSRSSRSSTTATARFDYGRHQRRSRRRSKREARDDPRRPAPCSSRSAATISSPGRCSRRMPRSTGRWRWSSSMRTRTPGTTTASASTTARSSAAPSTRASSMPERSIQIGIRTHAPDDCGIEILYGARRSTAMRASRRRRRASVDRVGGGKTYLTFDIDCLDPAYRARHRHAGLRAGRPRRRR